ncbi:metallo-beta-lactamase domain-containing protein 1 [Monodelphis domestica]|uniref:metallo-beta-lactamase domain-containing protein 1 n=1 Tax=Monodelphis domestica TaxID=13616 RepID=UPI0000D90439|nr:metallo-beta-lactamase domain-containing protein 1 [Monodelphis domestica]
MSLRARTEPLHGDPPLSIPGDPYSVVVLLRGYSEPEGVGGAQKADGSVTLVLPTAWKPRSTRWEAPVELDTQAALKQAGSGPVLVDTGGPWARDALLAALATHGVTQDAVTLVVGTHGHSDHVGSLGLFPRSSLLVSHDFCLPGGLYLPHGLSETNPLHLGPGLEVWATPGHAGLGDVSVVVAGTALGTVVVAGDVFEREGDGDSWRQLSEDPTAQERSRQRVLAVADVVVPGHGGPFRVFRDPGVHAAE